jgi:hypothetical protein
MRKSLVIFFISLYLVSTTEAYQLLKLPAFVFHFIQHSEQDPAMSLTDFLLMHYAEEQVLDADWQQDMQLPFKSHEDIFSTMSVVHFIPNFQLTISRTELLLVQWQAPRINDFLPGIYCADIFQPPRA